LLRTDDFGDAEADADDGVEEGRGGREDGEPRHVVEVGYLREDHLRDAEQEHVVAVPTGGARRAVAFPVVAVGLLNRPAGCRGWQNGTPQTDVPLVVGSVLFWHACSMLARGFKSCSRVIS
jgi:hypothetical protein